MGGTPRPPLRNDRLETKEKILRLHYTGSVRSGQEGGSIGVFFFSPPVPPYPCPNLYLVVKQNPPTTHFPHIIGSEK